MSHNSLCLGTGPLSYFGTLGAVRKGARNGSIVRGSMSMCLTTTVPQAFKRPLFKASDGPLRSL